jgi:hypothetical protein
LTSEVQLHVATTAQVVLQPPTPKGLVS